jgi:hypothetical protein
MDPIIVLAQRIRAAETALSTECRSNSAAGFGTRAEAIDLLLTELDQLYEGFFATVPETLGGAGEQILFAAERLPPSANASASRLRSIGEHMIAGQRLTSDLNWLQAFVRSMKGEAEKSSESCVLLLSSALTRAASPLLIHQVENPVRLKSVALPEIP